MAIYLAEGSSGVAPAWSSLSAEEALHNLGSGTDGLSESEAAERLRRGGPNQVQQKRAGLYRKLLYQFRNLFNLLLLAAALLSFLSGTIANDQSSIGMGLVILLVVLVSILFSIFQERKAEDTMRAIQGLIPDDIKVVRGGSVRTVLVKELVPGDVIDLEEGDQVPADARLIESYDLMVDNSHLTGESEALPRYITVDDEPRPTAERKNLVLAGTTIVSGTCRAVVIATGGDTQFGAIVGLAQQAEEPLSPLQLQLNRTARLNFIAAVLVSVIFLVLALFYLHLQAVAALLFMIGVMVSLVPEGFQVTVTLALSLSSLAMAKEGVVVKRLSAVETLGSATAICVDKTGTITEGKMSARKVWWPGTEILVRGEGFDPSGNVRRDGGALRPSDQMHLSRVGIAISLCNRASLVPPKEDGKHWTAAGDPMEAALLSLAAKVGQEQKEALRKMPRAHLYPFDSKRKMMTSVHSSGPGKVAFVKGASSEVLARCTRLLTETGEEPLDGGTKAAIAAEMEDLAGRSFRVLAVADRILPDWSPGTPAEEVENQLTFLGLVALHDPMRKDIPEAMRKAKEAGIKVLMLTGDHKGTALAIAREAGIDGSMMTGDELEAIDEAALKEALSSGTRIFARVTAAQKLRIVRRLQADGDVVAVTGDGINDVPALLEADIGVAMGRSGTDAAREAGDLVLMDDSFASIVRSVERGRGVYDNLRKFLLYDFTHNWAELVPFISFIMLQTPLPLAVIQVLAIDLILEMPPSLSLTMDEPDERAMTRPPRSASARIFSSRDLVRTLAMGALIGVAGLLFCFLAWTQHGWVIGESAMADQAGYVLGTTVMMAAIMIGQLGTLLVCRSAFHDRFSLSPGRNPWLIRALAAEVVVLLAIIYLPPLQAAFSAGPVPAVFWAGLLLIVPLVLLLELGRRWSCRWSSRPECLQH
jgi:magnesium-transporting ATPase (P-type)